MCWEAREASMLLTSVLVGGMAVSAGSSTTSSFIRKLFISLLLTAMLEFEHGKTRIDWLLFRTLLFVGLLLFEKDSDSERPSMDNPA